MLVIRPIRVEDLDQLLAITHLTGFGLTTLPQKVDLLQRRIRESLRGFAKLTDSDPPARITCL
jgi:arginine N-succinyltransferase